MRGADLLDDGRFLLGLGANDRSRGRRESSADGWDHHDVQVYISRKSRAWSGSCRSPTRDTGRHVSTVIEPAPAQPCRHDLFNSARVAIARPPARGQCVLEFSTTAPRPQCTSVGRYREQRVCAWSAHGPPAIIRAHQTGEGRESQPEVALDGQGPTRGAQRCDHPVDRTVPCRNPADSSALAPGRWHRPRLPRSPGDTRLVDRRKSASSTRDSETERRTVSGLAELVRASIEAHFVGEVHT